MTRPRRIELGRYSKRSISPWLSLFLSSFPVSAAHTACTGCGGRGLGGRGGAVTAADRVADVLNYAVHAVHHAATGFIGGGGLRPGCGGYLCSRAARGLTVGIAAIVTLGTYTANHCSRYKTQHQSKRQSFTGIFHCNLPPYFQGQH
ncbi:MAG: hypothetical protein E7594_02990 [Ruminococcaceae bacterium]|nr:hypothetical protein [Oscillospiraceae bacterium]